jgi:formiminotetrahydrofolate cyclodeaminase
VVEDPDSARFRDLTLGAFVGRLASSDPVPGGGSASAVAGALGAALVTMVASLSIGRPKYAAHAAVHERASADGRRLADRFLAIADEDAAAYGGFAAAMKLPRETDAEREARTRALQAAARSASEVPLACVEAALELVSVAEGLAGRSNVNAASDLAVAANLGEAAAEGAAANVRINLGSIGDPEVAEGLDRRVEELLIEVRRLADFTREAVGSGVSR